MITEGVNLASASASADLPLAVGPAMSARGGRVFMFIATLVAGERLSAGEISMACDAVRGTASALIDDVACDIRFSGDLAASRSALEAMAGLDVIIQTESHRARRLLVADMDSTMITVECIDELADYAGLKAEVSAVTERAMRGEIDFGGALRDRMALLAGMPEATIAACLRERVKLMGGAKDLVQSFRLIVKNGELTGEVETPIVDAQTKETTLLDTLTAMNLPRSASIAIGDGANDIPMIEAAGLGIAYHAKPKTQAAADACVRLGDLRVVRYALGL